MNQAQAEKMTARVCGRMLRAARIDSAFEAL